MKKKITISLIILAVIVAVIAIYFAQKPKEPETIKIGAILPLTGPTALVGEWARNGLQIGIEEINKSGGINGKYLDIKIHDSAGDPKRAISIFNEMVAQNIKCILVAGSSESLSLIPLAEKNKIILISHASHPKITGRSKYVFRHSNVADDESEILIQFLKTEIKPKRVTIIVSNDDYGIAFKNECVKRIENTGIDLVEAIEYDKTQINFKDIVNKLLYKKPEAIILAGLGKGLGILIKTIREQKFKGPLLSTSGFAITDAPIVAGDAAKGLYYCDFIINKEQDSYKKFAEIYEKKFKKTPFIGPLLFYNSLMLIKKCIEDAGYESDKISSCLRSIDTFVFAGEEMKILRRGDIIPKMKVLQYK